MDRSIGDSTSSSESVLPFAHSLLGGIKRVIGFFVMSEDEMSQAGIDLGNTSVIDSEDQMDPSYDSRKSGRVR